MLTKAFAADNHRGCLALIELDLFSNTELTSSAIASLAQALVDGMSANLENLSLENISVAQPCPRPQAETFSIHLIKRFYLNGCGIGADEVLALVVALSRGDCSGLNCLELSYTTT